MDRRERSDSLFESISAAQQARQAGIWTAMPAIVQSFNAEQMTIVAQPAIQAQMRAPDGKVSWATLSLLLDVPVLFQGGGGYTLTFPIVAGDEALIVFSSRCLDAWWQSGGVQVQAELRMHDLSDGFALVGLRSLPRVPPAVSTTATQLRTDDGQTYIEIAPGGLVRIQATDVEVHARHSYSWDVNGYGERVTYVGDNTWEVHTWKTPRPGDTVNTVASTINPPEIP